MRILYLRLCALSMRKAKPSSFRLSQSSMTKAASIVL